MTQIIFPIFFFLLAFVLRLRLSPFFSFSSWRTHPSIHIVKLEINNNYNRRFFPRLLSSSPKEQSERHHILRNEKKNRFLVYIICTRYDLRVSPARTIVQKRKQTHFLIIVYIASSLFVSSVSTNAFSVNRIQHTFQQSKYECEKMWMWSGRRERKKIKMLLCFTNVFASTRKHSYVTLECVQKIAIFFSSPSIEVSTMFAGVDYERRPKKIYVPWATWAAVWICLLQIFIIFFSLSLYLCYRSAIIISWFELLLNGIFRVKCFK